MKTAGRKRDEGVRGARTRRAGRSGRRGTLGPPCRRGPAAAGWRRRRGAVKEAGGFVPTGQGGGKDEWRAPTEPRGAPRESAAGPELVACVGAGPERACWRTSGVRVWTESPLVRHPPSTNAETRSLKSTVSGELFLGMRPFGELRMMTLCGERRREKGEVGDALRAGVAKICARGRGTVARRQMRARWRRRACSQG